MAIVWVAGFVASIAGLAAGLAVSGTSLEDAADEPLVTGVAALVQLSGMLATMWLISRLKGLGSLVRDFGLRFARDDWPYLFAGVGLFFALAIVTLPLTLIDQDEQEIVEQMRDASGAGLLLLAITAVVGAPLVEELLFRGLLLRALLRRTGPVAAAAWSGLVFGVVHLTDPGAIRSLPIFVGLGTVSAAVALRTGRIGPSILLHAGFNAVTTTYLALG